ncbi:PREDICTED: transmembrane protein 164-like [Amphimedon queenslandica]|uniref:Transmembrane protein 164 n=1 Tax=Amphimedon queenslandica TaxID=400682 RepID=A0A1X7VR86_AMPQE|nr:PREDICTED: transmembrane protein 164-like [Amphimedon queenslandica]|eukprot:XP_011405786.2 PREDICTED: transmembrane protein 164-like [Amphimedon queenslandica]
MNSKYNNSVAALVNGGDSFSGSSLLFELEDVLYGGDSTKEEINNESCFNYLSTRLALTDTVIAVVFIIYLISYAVKTISANNGLQELARVCSAKKEESDSIKTLLLVTLSIVLGVEIGYKLASKEAIFFLFFCHLITATQIYLLAAPITPFSTAVLRCMMHILHLAFFGIIFMDVNGRQFHGEVALSWIQHVLIFAVVPPYLVYHRGGTKALESLTDFSWSSLSGAVFLILCYFVHQPVSMITRVNINFLLCPISPYPFEGPYYRLAAVFHQTLLIQLLGKLYRIALEICLPKNISKIN